MSSSYMQRVQLLRKRRFRLLTDTEINTLRSACSIAAVDCVPDTCDCGWLEIMNELDHELQQRALAGVAVVHAPPPQRSSAWSRLVAWLRGGGGGQA